MGTPYSDAMAPSTPRAETSQAQQEAHRTTQLLASRLQDFDESIDGKSAEVFDQELQKLQEQKSKLVAAQTYPKSGIDVSPPPLGRQTNILSLPDELLLHIFEYLEDCTPDGPLTPFYWTRINVNHGDIATCRLGPDLLQAR